MPTEGIPTPHFSGTSTTPATTRKLARWLGASAIACACWPLGAAGADATAGVADREGDVVVDPAGPQWKAPDILGASLSYITGADADLTDDVVQGQMRIDASPDPGVQTKLYAGRAMSWRVDTDGNPNTGATTGNMKGADVVVVAFGSSSGDQNRAYVRRWVNGAFESTGRAIALQTSIETGFSWTATPADMGIVRGVNTRVWFEAVWNQGAASDIAPDDGCGIALFTPFPAPQAQAGDATDIGTDRAVIPGTVDGLGTGTDWFVEYGVEGQPQVSTAPAASPPGAPQALAVPLVGLTPATRYTYRVVARNAWGETRSAALAFTTASPPAPPAPPPAPGGPDGTAAGVVTAASRTSLTFNGTIAPAAAPSNWWFEWGTSPRLGHTTARSSVGPAAASVPVRVRVAGLEPGTTYYYRLVTTVGGTRVRTAVRTARTLPAGRLTLNGRVRFRCASGACVLSPAPRLTVRVRTATNAVVRGRPAARGLRARLHCVRGCRVRGRAVPVRVMRADPRLMLGRSVRTLALRPGAVVELRVTRSGATGVLYRARVTRAGVRAGVCAMAYSATRCATAPRRAAGR